MKKTKPKRRPTAILFLFTLFFVVMQISCTQQIPTNVQDMNFIPQPVSVDTTEGAFVLGGKAMVFVQEGQEGLVKIGQFLATKLNKSTGFQIEVKETSKVPRKGNIYLTLGNDPAIVGDEGYQIDVTNKLLTLKATKPEGLFRGVQTIRQLFPDNGNTRQEAYAIKAATINDAPSYTYRGMMLDVSRHFFGVEDVKKVIDHLAYYKFNHLHLHLSDDQGWRIEIKSWPNLTAHGGSTQVGGGEGGYYTQEQYKELVAYAASRFITIVPEIDMPGHTNAALASYPELNCDGKAPELYTGTEVGFSSLCIDKEITYEFVDDVLTELVEITPGPYIHIGGDESHSTKKEDFIYFIEKVQDMVFSKGKTMIGWDEVAHAELHPKSIAQYWSKDENAKLAIKKGAKVIVSPGKYAYLDMKYDSTTVLGLNWAGYIEVDHGYSWSPDQLTEGIAKENILGIEAPLWSETVTNMDEIEYLVFPRLLGYAEIGWTPAPQRNWEDYKVRLGKFAPQLKAAGIDYYPSALVPWVE